MGGRFERGSSYSQSVWELDRALEDDSRAADLFAWLATAGVATWAASFIVADSLLPITSIAALGSLVFGIVGWRASKHGDPREATNFVAVTLAVVLAVLWALDGPVGSVLAWGALVLAVLYVAESARGWQSWARARRAASMAPTGRVA